MPFANRFCQLLVFVAVVSPFTVSGLFQLSIFFTVNPANNTFECNTDAIVLRYIERDACVDLFQRTNLPMYKGTSVKYGDLDQKLSVNYTFYSDNSLCQGTGTSNFVLLNNCQQTAIGDSNLRDSTQLMIDPCTGGSGAMPCPLGATGAN
jgi:hypothetical protein